MVLGKLFIDVYIFNDVSVFYETVFDVMVTLMFEKASPGDGFILICSSFFPSMASRVSWQTFTTTVGCTVERRHENPSK